MGAGKINHAMGMVVPENYHEYGPDAGAIGGPFTWQELSVSTKAKGQREDILGKSNAVKSGILRDIYPGKIIKRRSLEATLPLNGIDNRLDRPLNGYNTFDWGPVSVKGTEMPDGKMATWAIEKLTENYDKPFFLGVGFYRPHQPFYGPEKYFEPFKNKLSLPAVMERDLADLPQVAKQYAHYHWSGSFARVTEYKAWEDAVRGYLASIHFVDAQLGKIVDALDDSSYANNTLIVLWSDHGWELGEKEYWGKHSPWQGSIKVPFIIVPPKNSRFTKGENDSFVSLIDIYPTIAYYMSVDVPNYLEGSSLKSVIEGRSEKVRDYSLTTLNRASYVIVKGNWKYIHYYDGSEELYNLHEDPNE